MQQVPDMLKEKISEFIDTIRSIEGVAACALVSRDGIVAGKYFDRDLNEPWLGALLATILSSAESVGGIIRMKSLESIVNPCAGHLGYGGRCRGKFSYCSNHQ